MYLLAASLLTLTGLGGLFAATLRFRGGNPPMLIPILHGELAIIAVLTVIIALIVQFEWTMAAALGLAALGAPFGLALFMQHKRQQLVSLGVLACHGLLELSAVIISWFAALGG